MLDGQHEHEERALHEGDDRAGMPGAAQNGQDRVVVQAQAEGEEF